MTISAQTINGFRCRYDLETKAYYIFKGDYNAAWEDPDVNKSALWDGSDPRWQVTSFRNWGQLAEYLGEPVIYCQYCNEPGQYIHYYEKVMQELVDGKACHECNFWLEKLRWHMDGDRTSDGNQIIRTTDFEHYTLGEEPGRHTSRGILGFGGAAFTFKLHHTGEIVTSHNVWAQGKIPDIWKTQLMPNASVIPQPTMRLLEAVSDDT